MEMSTMLRRAAMSAVVRETSSSDFSTREMRKDNNYCRNFLRIPFPREIKKRIMCQNNFLHSRSISAKAPSSVNPQAHVLEEGSINNVYDALAACLYENMIKLDDPNAKYLVGLAGPPGAGKSTVASEVISRLNRIWAQKFPSSDVVDVATIIPMDGFHLYRSQLDAMEDPQEAHARRGAPWTFDPVLLLKCLQMLKKQGWVYAPSFDHGVGDPVEEDIVVGHHHKVVIVEGNYLFLEDDTWKEISSMFDEKWFIDIDLDTAMERVFKRHKSTGKTSEVAKWRVDYNDRPNAELIMKSKRNADLVIKSVDWDS